MSQSQPPSARIPFQTTMNRVIIASSISCLLLLSLFTFSSARTPSHSTHINHDHDIHHPSFPMSLIIDVHKPEPKPLTQVDHREPKTVASETSYSKAEETIESIEVPTETSEISNPLPFTIFSFHPMDPRIPRRPSPLSFRPHHHCHHNNKNRHYKPWKPLLPHHRHRGNHMMPNNNVDDRKQIDPVAARGEVRPDERMKIDRIEPMFSRERSLALMERRELLKRLYHRYHHRRQAPAEIKDTGLIKRIRKFLNRF